jgi:hypothetical protein
VLSGNGWAVEPICPRRSVRLFITSRASCQPARHRALAEEASVITACPEVYCYELWLGADSDRCRHRVLAAAAAAFRALGGSLARQQQSHLWRNASLNLYILPAPPQNFGCQSAEIGFEIRHEQTPFDDQGHEVTTTRWTAKMGGQIVSRQVGRRRGRRVCQCSGDREHPRQKLDKSLTQSPAGRQTGRSW